MFCHVPFLRYDPITVKAFNFTPSGNFALFFPTGMLTSKRALQKNKGIVFRFASFFLFFFCTFFYLLLCTSSLKGAMGLARKSVMCP
jgi:hypothetical protein